MQQLSTFADLTAAPAQNIAPEQERWSPRRTIFFAGVSSLALWGLIVGAVWWAL